MLHVLHPRESQYQPPGDPLVGQVVNREQRGHLLVERLLPPLGIQPGRDDTGVPIVGVNHVRLPVQHAERGQGGPAEDGEPLRVILETVHPIAGQVHLVPDEIDRHLVHLSAEEMNVLLVASGGHGERRGERAELERVAPNGAVAGDHQAHVVPQGPDGLGERAGHVGQPSHFGERHRFSGEKQDFEGLLAHWYWCSFLTDTTAYAPWSQPGAVVLTSCAPPSRLPEAAIGVGVRVGNGV